MDREKENQRKRKILSEIEEDKFAGGVDLKLSLSPCPSDIPSSSTTPISSLSSLPPLPSGSYNLISHPPPLLPQFSLPPPVQEPLMAPPPFLDTSQTRRPTTTARRYPPQRSGRTRRSPKSSNSKTDKIRPPFPWATDRPATVHSLEYLRSQNIKKITGEVQCKKCNARLTYEFDLNEKFREVAEYIIRNKDSMHERAPNRWLHSDLPACNQCGQANSMKPVIPVCNEEINWLFLLLGEMLGECTLEQLKYFCMHTKNHRTGAKDRLLFLTFLALSKQLDPQGPFER